MLGVGLSASCGFRVFVPLLVFSLGSRAGYVHLPDSFAWVGSTPALIAFGVATIVEVLGYMVPWVDHLLDVLTVPAAIAAGTVITYGMFGEASPPLRWSVALIAGGGTAGFTGLSMAALRGGSTATTGGIANPLLSMAETATSTVMAVVSVLFPLIAFLLFFVICYFCIRLILKPFFKTQMADKSINEDLDF